MEATLFKITAICFNLAAVAAPEGSAAEDERLLIVTLAVGAGIFLVALILWLIFRRRTKGPKQLLEVGEMIGATWDGLKLSGEIDGFEYGVNFVNGGKNTPRALHIAIRSGLPSKITVRLQNGLDRLAASIGLTHEVETGDPDFDEKFFLDGPDDELVAELFRNDKTRAGVMEIFQSNAEDQPSGGAGDILKLTAKKAVLTFDEEKTELKLIGYKLSDSATDSTTILKVLPELVDLAARAREVGGRFSPKKDNETAFVALAISTGALMLFGMIAFAVGSEVYRPLGWDIYFTSLEISLPALAVFMVLSFNLLKGRSASGARFGLVLLLAICGFLIAGAGGGVFINGYFDEGRPELATGLVREKKLTHNKSSTSYYFYVKSADRPADEDKLKVARELYNAIEEGDMVVFEVMPGALGFPWQGEVFPTTE